MRREADTPRSRAAGRRVTRRVALFAVPLAVLLSAACGDPEPAPEVELPVEDGDGRVVEPGASVVGRGDTRADSIQGVLTIEGMEEPIVFRLYRSGPAFSPSFSTYLPNPFRPEPAGADTVRFRMGSGAAVFEVVSLPDGTSGAEARRMARAMVGTGEEVETSPLVPGALLTVLGSADGRTAQADLVRRWDRYVVLLVRYPPEYGDGVGPRGEAIREAWVWSDDGSPLTGPVVGAAGERGGA